MQNIASPKAGDSTGAEDRRHKIENGPVIVWDCPEVVEKMKPLDMQNRIVRVLKEFDKRVTLLIISRKNVLQELSLKFHTYAL